MIVVDEVRLGYSGFSFRNHPLKTFFSLFPQCEPPSELFKPCEAHQNKFPYAKKECSILYSDVFAPCRNVVNECFTKLSNLNKYCCIYNIEMNRTNNLATHWLFRYTT